MGNNARLINVVYYFTYTCFTRTYTYTTEAMTQLIHALTIFQRYQVMLITQTAGARHEYCD